jgi:hypothetical protein
MVLHACNPSNIGDVSRRTGDPRAALGRSIKPYLKK